MVNYGTMDEMAKVTDIIIHLARVVDTINDTDKNRLRTEYTSYFCLGYIDYKKIYTWSPIITQL